MKSFTRISLWLGMIAIAAALALPARANTWPLPPPGSRLVGQNQFHVVENNGGSLEAIAKKYNVGFLALLQANPGVDPYVPRAGSVLTIPLQTLLPDAPREGLVLNLAELRLYYYPPGRSEVTVYPIGIGQLGGDTITPTMVTTVSDKRANPTSGCIRLRDDDIKALYNEITPGTRVTIINTPIKVSVEPNGTRLVEVHQPLSKHIDDDPQTLPITLTDSMQAFKQAQLTDTEVMERAMMLRSGMPIDVTRHHRVTEQSL